MAVFFSVSSRQAYSRIFAGNALIFLAIATFCFCLLISMLIEIENPGEEILKNLRNITFWILVFIVSSRWLNTVERFDLFLKIFLIGILATCLYGVKQFYFGFTEYELERLSMMGRSVDEMEVLGRVRIGSTFGDPLTFAFFSMMGVFAVFIAKKRKIFPLLTGKFFWPSLALVFTCLVLTLTRAPLFGMFCGFLCYFIMSFKLNKKTVVSLILLVLSALLIGTSIYFWSTNEKLANSDNVALANISRGVDSMLSLTKIFASSEKKDEKYFLTAHSKDARLSAWNKSIVSIIASPFGQGVSTKGKYEFSAGDVGFFKYGLQIGILGMLSFVFLIVLIGIETWRKIRQIRFGDLRECGLLLVCMWVSIFVTCGISEIFQTSVISIVAWSFAGAMLNYQRFVLRASHDKADRWEMRR